MNQTISVKFSNYSENTFSFRSCIRSVNVYTEDLNNGYTGQYQGILKYNIYEIPNSSTHIIKFSKNRRTPFMDGYILKTEKAPSFTEEAESYFSIAGIYLDESIIESSFQNVPNDLVDYEKEPSDEEITYEDYTNLTRLNYG